MKFRGDKSGFTIVEIAILIAIIGIIGLLGYVVYNNQVSNSNEQKASQSATASDVKSAPAINSVADLDAAEALLDQTDPSGSNNADASQLDAELTHF